MKKRVLIIILALFLSLYTANACKPLIEVNNDSKINIIISGEMPEKVFDNISREDYLKELANKTIDYNGIGMGIFSIEPFKSNKDKFNLWYTLNNSCKINNSFTIKFIGKEEWFLANSDYYETANNYAPISNKSREEYKNARESIIEYRLAAWKIRSTSLGTLLDDKLSLTKIYLKIKKVFGLKYNLDINEYIIKTAMHEFGHTFAGLNDEYVLPGEENKKVISGLNSCFTGKKKDCLNPDKNKIWGDLLGKEGVYCYEGCERSRKNSFRSTKNSIMNKQLLEPYSYGLANERIICKRILELAGNVSGYCDRFKLY